MRVRTPSPCAVSDLHCPHDAVPAQLRVPQTHPGTGSAGTVPPLPCAQGKRDKSAVAAAFRWNFGAFGCSLHCSLRAGRGGSALAGLSLPERKSNHALQGLHRSCGQLPMEQNVVLTTKQPKKIRALMSVLKTCRVTNKGSCNVTGEGTQKDGSRTWCV